MRIDWYKTEKVLMAIIALFIAFLYVQVVKEIKCSDEYPCPIF